MAPFATIEDYRELYPNDETTDAVLNGRLMEATDLIMGELDKHDISYTDPSESFSYRLMRVCRTVVHRALGSTDASDVPFGATELMQKAGDFSASVNLANPYGDLFLTAQERESLGIGELRVAVLNPYA